MALLWSWDSKVGEATFERKTGASDNSPFTISLYQGNALLIGLYEFVEDGVERYNMDFFFVDEGHMKRCLGLQKNADGTKNNIFDTDRSQLIKIKIDPTRYDYTTKLVTALAKAFDNITIEFYREKGESNE